MRGLLVTLVAVSLLRFTTTTIEHIKEDIHAEFFFSGMDIDDHSEYFFSE